MICRALATLLLLCSTLFAEGPAKRFAEGPAARNAASSPAVVGVAPTVRSLPEAPSHRFFDRTNVALHLASFAALTSDFLTTRQIINGGGREANPIARPFVSSGWGGQIAGTYILGGGGTLLTAYWLHRTGHHRLERLAPICVGIVEGLAVASNSRLLAHGHLRR